MAVDRVVRIKSHAENPCPLALSHFGGDIEKRGWNDRAQGELNDLDLSILLGDKKPTDVRRAAHTHKAEGEASRDPERFEGGVTSAPR